MSDLPKYSLIPVTIDANTIKFQDCTTAFAIDQSGSTLGRVLELEKQVIRTISNQLSDTAYTNLRILPWSSFVGLPIRLSSLKYVDSYAGTMPHLLLTNEASRQTLQSSDIWFLLTDGCISETYLRRFAEQIAKHGLHGTAAVVIIFASTENKPAMCDISVGVAVFAAVPDCLFLYFDTMTEQVFMLQCSGRFTQILEIHNQDQPILEDSTVWSELPEVNFADLNCVSVRVPRKLSQDEILLPDGLLLNLKDLWQGRIDDDKIIDQIFKDDDNLKSILLTAQTRGEVIQFQNWLKPFLDDKPSQMLDVPELTGDSKKTILHLLEEIQSGASGERLQKLQEDLKASYTQNAPPPVARTSSHRRRVSSNAALKRSFEVGSRARALSAIVKDDRSVPQEKHKRTISQVHPPLMTPGFKVPTHSRDMHVGNCSLCGDINVTLVLLLRSPPTDIATPGFPPLYSRTKVTCPLAIGNFPETDIISSLVCCDTCSFHMAQAGIIPHGEKLRCVLPLVTYSINHEAYKRQLRIALNQRFQDEDLLEVFLAIAVNTLQRLPEEDTGETINALKWVCKDLLQNYYCSTNEFSQDESYRRSAATPRRLGTAIKSGFESLYRNPKALESLDQSLEAENIFSYPLPGFVVMVMLLQHSEVSPELPFGSQNVVWQRFLFQLIENYLAIEDEDEKEEARGILNVLEIRLEEKRKVFRDSGVSVGTINSQETTNPEVMDAELTWTLDDLVRHNLLAEDELGGFRSLGKSFEWIESRATPAIYLFLQLLMAETDHEACAWEMFDSLRRKKDLSRVFEEPMGISVKSMIIPTRAA